MIFILCTYTHSYVHCVLQDVEITEEFREFPSAEYPHAFILSVSKPVSIVVSPSRFKHACEFLAGSDAIYRPPVYHKDDFQKIVIPPYHLAMFPIFTPHAGGPNMPPGDRFHGTIILSPALMANLDGNVYVNHWNHPAMSTMYNRWKLRIIFF